MLTCSICLESKSEDQFHDDAKSATGKRGHCKKCRNSKQGAYQKTEAGKLALLKAKMKYRYGITLDQYLEISASQEDKCFLCGEEETLPGRGGITAKLAVDHDHSCCPGPRSCGKCVRGLLCQNCNLYMAKVDRSTILMVRFSDYIHRRALEI